RRRPARPPRRGDPQRIPVPGRAAPGAARLAAPLRDEGQKGDPDSPQSHKGRTRRNAMIKPTAPPFLSLLCISLCSLCLCGESVRAHDWPQMRGPEQTGVSRDKNLPDSFDTDPDAKDNNLIWRQPYGGRTTPGIMNGRVYIIAPSNEGVTADE